MSFYSSKEEVVKLLNGKTVGDLKGMPCRGVEYDSRQIKGGELFIAMKGEASHGHAFLGEASKRGAALFLVEDSALLDTFPEKERLIVVPDTLAALWTLATYWRKKLNLPTIAVTGSVGKTTTKEMLASILLQKGVGNYALKSFNNHVGVPYTMLRSSTEHEWCVLEIGMNHPGEIERLSRIALPDVAVVTEVVPAHIGAFSNLEGIGREKLSITTGLRKRAPLVVNGDNEVIASLRKELKIDDACSVITAGTKETNTYRVSRITSTEELGISFHVEGPELLLDAVMSIAGHHNARNAVIACAAARALLPDMSTELIKKGLESFQAPLMRLNLKKLEDGREVLDDSYNANPASMSALLQIASDQKAKGKKIGLILGDMLELGDFSEKYHRLLGEEVGALAPAFLACVGPMAKFVVEEAVKKGVSATISSDPVQAAETALQAKFDLLFVKGSRGIKLDQAVAHLLSVKKSS